MRERSIIPILEVMRLANCDGSIAKKRAGLVKVALLNLDDVGIAPVKRPHAPIGVSMPGGVTFVGGDKADTNLL